MSDFSRGQQAFTDGDPRVMPSRYLIGGGHRPVGEGIDQVGAKAWFRGWDAANLAAPLCDWLVRVASGHPEQDFPSDLYTDVECGAVVRLSSEPGVESVCDNGHERFKPDEAGMVKLVEWELLYDLETGDVW